MAILITVHTSIAHITQCAQHTANVGDVYHYCYNRWHFVQQMMGFCPSKYTIYRLYKSTRLRFVFKIHAHISLSIFNMCRLKEVDGSSFGSLSIQSQNQTKHTTAQLDQLAPLNQPRVNDFCFVNQTEKMETNRLSRFTHFAYKLLFNDKIGRNKRAVGYFSFGTWSQNHRNIWLCVEYLECMMCHSCLLFRIR